MAYLDHCTTLLPLRPLPLCTSCGTRFDFDRAVMVWEQVFYEAGNCPDCCTALVKSEGVDTSPFTVRSRPDDSVPDR